MFNTVLCCSTLDPFNSVRENIGFLRRIVGDGSPPLPFAGCSLRWHRVKTELHNAGRLKGDVLDPDYDFLDPRLDGLFRE